MDSFRLNEYSRLLKYNRSLCLCEDKWRIQLNKYDLLESALYLPIALNNGIQIDCDKATPIFSKLSELMVNLQNLLSFSNQFGVKTRVLKNSL